MIDGWVANLKSHRCNYMAVEYPEFAKPGGYQIAINHKPAFIQEALKACYPRAIVYIDGDMFVNHYPHIFDLDGIDYAARNWDAEPRDSYDGKRPCFDPYVFETSGGIQMFGQTAQAYHMIQRWIDMVKKYPGKADDRIMAMAFNHHRFLLEGNVIPLPFEYLWLTMDYDNEVDRKFYKRSEIMVEHPACLTSEDRATALGASSDRVPKGYNRSITNQVKCNTKYGDFFEFIFFEDQRQRSTMSTYLNWLKDHHVMRLIPYAKGYGPHRLVAKKMQTAAKAIPLLPKLSHEKWMVVTTDTTAETASGLYLHVVHNKSLLLATMLAYLQAGRNVVYLPKAGKVPRKLLNRICSDGQMEFVCQNNNQNKARYKKEFILKIDWKQPMFLSAQSKILQHLLLISGEHQHLDTRFNSSFTFISRIRCQWM